jgi:erythromycin esterase
VSAAQQRSATMTPGTHPELLRWLREQAVPLGPVELTAPLLDLAPLRSAVGDATVVGIGGSTYGASEHFVLTARVLRFLVEELGFRSVVTEEDWDVGLEIDRYLCTGTGDLDALVAGAGVPWRVAEVRDALAWLRERNAAHPKDPVRFAGVGVIDTRAPVYDLIEAYVAEAAPDRLAALRSHLAPIRPTRPDHVRWLFTEATDKPGLVEHARAVQALVDGLPGTDPATALVRQHARQIVGFYEHYTFHVVDDGYRDLRMAENVGWWQEYTGHRVVYWSTLAHSARSGQLSIPVPPRGTLHFVPTGTHLAERYGSGYVSIGLTFGSGAVLSGWGLPPFTARPLPTPPVPAGFAEVPLGDVVAERFLLDLRGDPPPPAREWRDGAARTRLIGSIGAADVPAEDYRMTGGSLSQWCDLLLHSQVVTPTHPVSA